MPNYRDLDLPLGKIPDLEIARLYNLNRRSVCYIRNKLGILPFIGHILTQEGFKCRSILEAKFDAYLHWKNIPHKHEVRVPNLPYIADFYSEGSFIEIVGLIDYNKYKEKLIKKHRDYDRHCIPCAWYESGSVEYLYKNCPLELKFIDRFCIECGIKTINPSNLMCRPCDRKNWGLKNSIKLICQYCKLSFNRPAGSEKNANKFCSRSCYWNSLKIENPSKQALAMRRWRERNNDSKNR